MGFAKECAGLFLLIQEGGMGLVQDHVLEAAWTYTVSCIPPAYFQAGRRIPASRLRHWAIATQDGCRVVRDAIAHLT